MSPDIDVQLRACTASVPAFVTQCVGLHRYPNSFRGDLLGHNREDFARLPGVPEDQVLKLRVSILLNIGTYVGFRDRVSNILAPIY